MAVIIGTVTFSKARRVRISSEYARWHDTIEVAPGTYDLFASELSGDKVKDWPGVAYRVSGPVVSSDWSPCFGGVPFADGVDKNLGQERSTVVQTYAHALAKAMCDGQAPEYRLIDGWRAVPVHFEYQGESHTTYAIERS